MSTISLVIISFGVLLGAIALAVPILGMWIMLIMSMVVSGSIGYIYPKLGAVQWSVAVISLGLMARSLFNCFTRRGPDREAVPIIIKGFFALVVIVIISTILNLHLKETLVASKNFFQFWSIPFGFYFVIKNEKTVKHFFFAFLVVAALEVPLAFIQYKYFAGGVFSGDAISGTFGGGMNRQGPSAELASFMVIQIAVILALSVKRAINLLIGVVTTGFFLIPIILSHAKIAVIFFPIIFLVLYGKDVFKRPAIAFTGFLVISMTTIGIFINFYQHAGEYSIISRAPKDASHFVEKSISRNINMDTKDSLSRGSVIKFWWQEHIRTGDILRLTFGHGLGAAKHSGIEIGHVANKLQYRTKTIGLTALSRLLWDIGLAGTLAFVAILTIGAISANRISKDSRVPKVHQAFMLASQVALLVFIISLPYKLSIINIQAFSSFCMFIVGYVVFWERELKRS